MKSDDMIKGEGEVETIKRTRVRIECDNCSNPATKKHTYLMPNARGNPKSAAYRKDDCSWCSDFDLFQCDECDKQEIETAVPDGYRWCPSFPLNNNFAHMFLKWSHEIVTTAATAKAKGRRPAMSDKTGFEEIARKEAHRYFSHTSPEGFDVDDMIGDVFEALEQAGFAITPIDGESIAVSAAAVLRWYDNDGSVGGAVGPMSNLRASLSGKRTDGESVRVPVKALRGLLSEYERLSKDEAFRSGYPDELAAALAAAQE